MITAVALCLGLSACGGVSQADYDKVVSARDALQLQVEQLQGELKAAKESSSQAEPSIGDTILQEMKSVLSLSFPGESFSIDYEEYKPDKYCYNIHIILKDITYRIFEDNKKKPEMQSLWVGSKETYLNFVNAAQDVVDSYNMIDSLAILYIELDDGYTIMSFSGGKIGVDMTK